MDSLHEFDSNVSFMLTKSRDLLAMEVEKNRRLTEEKKVAAESSAQHQKTLASMRIME